MSRCSRCNQRGARPCVSPDGAPLPNYHVERVRAEAAPRVDHTAEALRLRAAARRSV